MIYQVNWDGIRTFAQTKGQVAKSRAICCHSLSNQKSLLMTTKDTEAKMAYSLRSLDGGCMTTTAKTQKAKMSHILSNQKSLVMTTSIKDALSHASVSGAVKRMFSHGYDDTK